MQRANLISWLGLVTGPGCLFALAGLAAREGALQDGEGAAVLISKPPGGSRAAGRSYGPTSSEDGSIVAFRSEAPNLVEQDSNGFADIFVWSGKEGAIERVSLGPKGVQADQASRAPSMSADGRFIVFSSDATNLVANDDNSSRDVFYYDRELEVTRLISRGASQVGNGRSDNAAISSDGKSVAFESEASNLVEGDENETSDVFLWRADGSGIVRVSVGLGGGDAHGGSWLPSINGDGSVVSFGSVASNIVEGDANGVADVFVRDMARAVTERVSVSSSGEEASGQSLPSSISADGRRVAFQSWASDLSAGLGAERRSRVFVRDRRSGRTVCASSGELVESMGFCGSPVISRDGSSVLFLARSAPDNHLESMTAFLFSWEDRGVVGLGLGFANQSAGALSARADRVLLAVDTRDFFGGGGASSDIVRFQLR